MGWGGGTVIGAWGEGARTPSGLGGGGRALGPCTHGGRREFRGRPAGRPSRRQLPAPFFSATRRRTRRRCDAFARCCVTGAEGARVSRPVRVESHGSGDPCHAESGRSTSCGRSCRRRRAERARLREGATGAVEKVCGRAGKIPERRAALQPPREIPERGLKHRDACRRRLVPGRRPASSGFSGERKPACARVMRPSLYFSPAPFSLVDPHVHLWALRRLNYPWPAGVPSLHPRHRSEGDRRACGPVAVTHRQLAPPITLVRQCPAVRFVFR